MNNLLKRKEKNRRIPYIRYTNPRWIDYFYSFTCTLPRCLGALFYLSLKAPTSPQSDSLIPICRFRFQPHVLGTKISIKGT